MPTHPDRVQIHPELPRFLHEDLVAFATERGLSNNAAVNLLLSEALKRWDTWNQPDEEDRRAG